MQARTVTLVGINRTSVSVGLALKASPVELNIVGHDRNRDWAEAAKEKYGAVDKGEWNLINAVSQADILVLSVPMVDLENTFMVIGEEVQSHALVLDFSTLKGPGVKAAGRYLKQGHYVGATPILSAAYLADGRDDPAVASADLFRNGLMALTPSATADPQAVDTAVNFGRLLGSVPYFLDPMEYDSLIQGVETMPGILAAAVFGAASQSPAWRDMQRFANAPFGSATQALNLGVDIVPLALNDRAATLRWLDALMTELSRWRSAIQTGDPDMLSLMAGDLVLKREKWLKDRADNNWVEGVSQEINTPTFTEQMLGGWLGGKRKKGGNDN
jgi:prephenate dehydrogenase